ncbi:hypothetical protein [Cellulosimicrobium sp. JZ28]|uniref:hypothetical protein n=1 Tax=Cellulosimicrobium sp. JZ28 TaxID=1906273 RepID=UPI00188B2F0F|nr:hypothetical protein [Cellulosimicrobium sp. JZ28]
MDSPESLLPEPQPVEAHRVGEDSQDSGLVGLRAAKRWLDRTTRATTYTSQDKPFRDLLAFRWPHGGRTFSYDIGGNFIGGGIDNQTFLGEVKKYKNESDLPAHFRDFMVKSYVAYKEAPSRCDHFLWISWAPFQAQTWDKHCTYERVIASLCHPSNIVRGLGVQPGEDVSEAIDHEAAQIVASRIWLLTLSDRQDDLNLLDAHYKEIIGMIALEEGRR